MHENFSSLKSQVGQFGVAVELITSMSHIFKGFFVFLTLSVRRSDHQETGGDLEGARVPPD